MWLVIFKEEIDYIVVLLFLLKGVLFVFMVSLKWYLLFFEWLKNDFDLRVWLIIINILVSFKINFFSYW